MDAYLMKIDVDKHVGPTIRLAAWLLSEQSHITADYFIGDRQYACPECSFDAGWSISGSLFLAVEILFGQWLPGRADTYNLLVRAMYVIAEASGKPVGTDRDMPLVKLVKSLDEWAVSESRDAVIRVMEKSAAKIQAMEKKTADKPKSDVDDD